MRMKTWSIAAVALAVAVGCNRLPEPQPITDRIELQPFRDCAELESYLEETAALQMRAEIERVKAEREQGSWLNGRAMEDSAAPPSATPPGAPTAAGPNDYTTTNLQVGGVDEADFVKNDGTRIFVLSGSTLYASRSWPAEQLSLAGSLAIEGVPREMFLDDQDRVVVFSDSASTGVSGGWDECGDKRGCGRSQPSAVKVTVVDVSDLSRLAVLREDFLPGAYVSARRIGASVRVVVSDAFNQPPEVVLHPELSKGVYETDKGRFAAACDDLMEKNERIIRGRALADWMPPGRRRLGGQEVEAGYQCTDFFRPNAPTRLGVVTVATLNLDGDAPLQRTSIVGEADEIYASHASLYVAHRHWWAWPQDGQKDWTYLHKFDLADPDRAPYVASGGVEGHIVDQFSMDEHRGYLRVSSNATFYRDADFGSRCDCMGAFAVDRASRVSVLSEVQGTLRLVGRTPDLARGERLFATRFMGDRGYVVTFLQVDPLFSLDLSNPANPRVTGELKIPGFSTYLHPLDEGHLLAIGSTGEGWGASGVKLSVFDVTDPAQPRELWWVRVGDYSGTSEAQNDHRAFNYFPAKKLLAIPFVDHGYLSGGCLRSDLRLFTIDIDRGIIPKGALDMSDMYSGGGGYSWDWSWQPGVRRSVMADDFVYAICDAGIRSARIDSLGQPLATVRFDRSK